MPGPMHFNDHAELYERARPPYPEGLWTRLRNLHLLDSGVRVIDLGAGAGHATGPMIQAGAVVTAVEPGRALADRLSQRWPAANVLVDTAEDASFPPAAFDLAVAATAVHWFDLSAVLPKLHRTLVPGGHFVVWRTLFGDPAVEESEFRRRVATITGRRRESLYRPGPSELDTDGWVRQLTAGGLFVSSHIEHFRWSIQLHTHQIRDLFTTFSNWDVTEVDEAARAVDDLGGMVLEHYVTPLIVLDRAEQIPPGPEATSTPAE